MAADEVDEFDASEESDELDEIDESDVPPSICVAEALPLLLAVESVPASVLTLPDETLAPFAPPSVAPESLLILPDEALEVLAPPSVVPASVAPASLAVD
ncbi:MAG TPA: hypothetical protein VN936_04465 [Candidatus Acidoferrum sp.]|nr:hypothetical protein [Candidatus Acidoferrum sp.]